MSDEIDNGTQEGQAPDATAKRTLLDAAAGKPADKEQDSRSSADPELTKTRQEAARHRTEAKRLSDALAERETLLETTKNDLNGKLTTTEAERDNLRAELRDLKFGNAVRDAIAEADALRPAKLIRLIDQSQIKINEETGQPDPRSLASAIDKLKAEYPEEFTQTAGMSRDASAGVGGGVNGVDMNSLIRRSVGR